MNLPLYRQAAQAKLRYELSKVHRLEDLPGLPLTDSPASEELPRPATPAPEHLPARAQKRTRAPVLGACLLVMTGFGVKLATSQTSETMPTTPAALVKTAVHCATYGQQDKIIPVPEDNYGITAEAMYTEVMLDMHDHSTCSAASLMAQVALLNPGKLRTNGSFSGGDYTFPLSATTVTPTPQA